MSQVSPLPYSRQALVPSILLSSCITITGQTGVGSSSTIKALRERYDAQKMTHWRYVSAGSLMRSFAERLKMTIEEFAAFNREHPEEKWDEKCDQATAEFGKQNFTVIEGRLPHAFVPHAFHVLLVCQVGIRAHRRSADTNGKRSVENTVYDIIRRDDNDDLRYKLLYPGCLWAPEDYHLVIDTEKEMPAGVAAKIDRSHNVWQALSTQTTMMSYATALA